MKIIGTDSSEIKFLSGRSDAYGLISGACIICNFRVDSDSSLEKSCGDSNSVYEVTRIGHFAAVAASIVSGHVSSSLNPVDRCKPGLKKQTKLKMKIFLF